MPKKSTNKPKALKKVENMTLDKVGVYFRPQALKSIMQLLTMEYPGYRTIKCVKNINRLFNSLDMDKYKGSEVSQAYIWCIRYFSAKWLKGIATPALIAMDAETEKEYDSVKANIITTCLNSDDIMSAAEAKMIYDGVANALQSGYLLSMREEYMQLLEDIDINDPGAYKELATRLFQISQSLLDIRHSTNMITNRITFDTSDMDSVKSAVTQTIDSLKGDSCIFHTGITRLNTLLSPGYMNGRLYVYMGLPAGGKSIILLKSALDIRKYNPGFKPKTPGMKPCVLYITMENTFTESIERVWNMNFDEPITDFAPEEAVEKLCNVLGIKMILKDDVEVKDVDTGESLSAQLMARDKDNSDSNKEPNIEIVMKYFSYREISTDDLYTIIQDLRDLGLEVCALVFDYIKRIEPSEPAPDSVKIELNRIINELKALAVIQDIPVITAHQLNRAAAAAVDAAARLGKGDVTKMAGRENTGDAWEIMETGDWVAIINIEQKPGTRDRYMVLSVVKRRRVDMSDAEMASYTYMAHPFSKSNGMRLIDDYGTQKILSLRSLASDIDVKDDNKTNAASRLIEMEQSAFIEGIVDEY